MRKLYTLCLCAVLCACGGNGKQQAPATTEKIVELISNGVWNNIVSPRDKETLEHFTVWTKRDNSDYYSSTREAYWRCDLEELWDMLEEMDLNPVKE